MMSSNTVYAWQPVTHVFQDTMQISHIVLHPWPRISVSVYIGIGNKELDNFGILAKENYIEHYY